MVTAKVVSLERRLALPMAKLNNTTILRMIIFGYLRVTTIIRIIQTTWVDRQKIVNPTTGHKSNAILALQEAAKVLNNDKCRLLNLEAEVAARETFSISNLNIMTIGLNHLHVSVNSHEMIEIMFRASNCISKSLHSA